MAEDDIQDLSRGLQVILGHVSPQQGKHSMVLVTPNDKLMVEVWERKIAKMAIDALLDDHGGIKPDITQLLAWPPLLSQETISRDALLTHLF